MSGRVAKERKKPVTGTCQDFACTVTYGNHKCLELGYGMIALDQVGPCFILFPLHWRAAVTPVNNTLESSVKGFTQQYCAGNGGWKQFGKLMGCLGEWELQVNAPVPEFHTDATEFPSRLGSDGGISVGAASQKGSEREMMKKGWSEGLTECNMGGLKGFSHGFPFAVLLVSHAVFS